MPTGQTFAICGIWLYLWYLAVIRFVMLLVGILRRSSDHNRYSRSTVTVTLVAISVRERKRLPMIIIACFVFWGCIFGFCLLLGLKVFDYSFGFFDALFLCFGLVVG